MLVYVFIAGKNSQLLKNSPHLTFFIIALQPFLTD